MKKIEDLKNCIHIDFKKGIIRCPKKTWIAFESKHSIFIYPDKQTFNLAAQDLPKSIQYLEGFTE